MWSQREGASLYRGEAGVKGIANPTDEVKPSNRDVMDRCVGNFSTFNKDFWSEACALRISWRDDGFEAK